MSHETDQLFHFILEAHWSPPFHAEGCGVLDGQRGWIVGCEDEEMAEKVCAILNGVCQLEVPE